ncbi:aldehyde dehydrogenase family protein [Saccharothrix obliqua]|uniref:aldehyde dehydrogenase family protein n=1 Tax=Saccharothrix obliqua TaxID=2861747 RepID=UPI001C602D6D|nr:aldehyde dehydrogenase family protein [Saccharothrix obliqua]MBW4718695.1 aldehyde dehydrogenase family protein [Saccharothrix obliqua]
MSSTRELCHYIGGQPVRGASGRFADVHDASSGAVVARVPLASADEVRHAVATAERAQVDWAAWHPRRRARVLMRFLELVRHEVGYLATALATEHGRTVADAEGDVQRGLEAVEFAAGVPHLLRGEFAECADVDVHSVRQPLGVVAGITPADSPAMVPLWQAAPALVCGNAFVLKPSERDPTVPLLLASLLTEAGLPPGVFTVVNGDSVAADALPVDPGVAAVGFVGAAPDARRVHGIATAAGKRARCSGRAKHHLVVMPDADLDAAVTALLQAGRGPTGGWCTAVPVGAATATALVAALADRLRELTVGAAHDGATDLGPLVSADAVRHARDHVETGVAEGAELVVDRRDVVVPGYANGYYLGPVLLDHVTADMRVHHEDVSGPVFTVVRADDYEHAVRLAGEHGDGAAIFTRDRDAAHDFSSRVDTGVVGVNVVAPTTYHAFSGCGDPEQHGLAVIRFCTRAKTVTEHWSAGRGPVAAADPVACHRAPG